MSKLNDFLKKNKIDARRILGASDTLESLQPEDRIIRLAQERVRQNKASDAQKELATKKRRGGRPVSAPTLARALRGEPLASKARARILRALNSVLTQKKKPEIQSADIF